MGGGSSTEKGDGKNYKVGREKEKEREEKEKEEREKEIQLKVPDGIGISLGGPRTGRSQGPRSGTATPGEEKRVNTAPSPDTGGDTEFDKKKAKTRGRSKTPNSKPGSKVGSKPGSKPPTPPTPTPNMLDLTVGLLMTAEYSEEDYSYAEWIGIDLDAHPQLMYLAREGLHAPVPEPWVRAKVNGHITYVNRDTHETSTDHPLDDYYRSKYNALVEGEDYLTLEEYIIQNIRPKTSSDQLDSRPIIISNTNIKFVDVTTGYEIVMTASPEGVRYTVNGDSRPPVKKVNYDVNGKMLRFTNLNRGVTLPRDNASSLITAIKRLCELSNVPHNIAKNTGLVSEFMEGAFVPVVVPEKKERKQQRKELKSPEMRSPGMRSPELRSPGSMSSEPDMAPQAKKGLVSRIRSKPRAQSSTEGAFSPLELTPRNQPPQLPSSPLDVPMDAPMQLGSSSLFPDIQDPSEPVVMEPDIYEDFLSRLEQHGISEEEMLDDQKFNDRDIDELLKDLSYGVLDRHKLKSQIELTKLEKIAETKNREIDASNAEEHSPSEPAPHPLEDGNIECNGRTPEELNREASENAEILAAVGVHKVPDAYVCTITGEIMVDPTCTCDGHVYERHAIKAWLVAHETSPNTNQKLETKALIPNLAIRKAIASWKTSVIHLLPGS